MRILHSAQLVISVVRAALNPLLQNSATAARKMRSRVAAALRFRGWAWLRFDFLLIARAIRVVALSLSDCRLLTYQITSKTLLT